MTVHTYPGVPAFNGTDINSWLIRARTVINGCLGGKTNNTDTVTLNTSTATTTVVLAEGRLGPNSVILFMPTTPAAAVESAIGTMYVSKIDSLNNMFLIANAVNNVNTRTFNYVIIG